jgi:hypothetical protein
VSTIVGKTDDWFMLGKKYRRKNERLENELMIEWDNKCYATWWFVPNHVSPKNQHVIWGLSLSQSSLSSVSVRFKSGSVQSQFGLSPESRESWQHVSFILRRFSYTWVSTSVVNMIGNNLRLFPTRFRETACSFSCFNLS